MFLKNDMIRESSVRREINLEEKRAYAPIPMVEEPYFSIPAKIAPPVQTTVVATPVVDVGVSGTSQSEQVAHTTIESESHAPTVHEPPELEEEIVNEDPPPQQPQVVEEDVPIRRSQRVRRLAIPDDYEVYISVDMN